MGLGMEERRVGLYSSEDELKFTEIERDLPGGVDWRNSFGVRSLVVGRFFAEECF